jgi:hypothetical protein
MRKKSLTLAMMLITLMMTSAAQAQIPTDSIVADFNEFVRLMEETHPDPYTNYGGRVFFRKAVMDTRKSLIDDKVTDANELAKRINAFLVPLHDGHTWMQTADNSDMMSKKAAPIRFQAINDGIIVEAIMSDHKELIGSRLIAIENIPVKEICDGLAQHYPSENEIGRLSNICQDRGFMVDLGKVIPNMPQDSLSYQLLTPEGKQINLNLPLVGLMEIRGMSFSRPERSTLFPGKNLAYSFVDDKKDVMYFRSQSIMDRDALKFMYDNGWDYEWRLQNIYRYMVGGDMPANPIDAIEKIPSFSGEFEKMLQEMKNNKSKNLIIDLRGNDGGFTPITLATLYQLWGDQYLKDQSNWGIVGAQLVSPLLLKKYNATLEDFNAESHTDFQLGDYAFEDEEIVQGEITEEVRNGFIANCMSSVKDKLTAQKGKPVYTPEHIYVLTDPGTFSAAFHYAFFLSKMGAKVVGVPCSQAPNTYMEVTPFELPRTKLNGSFSNALQLFLPIDDPRAKDFYPDLMPTYEDFKRYNFDDNAIPMYLLDYIKNQK